MKQSIKKHDPALVAVLRTAVLAFAFCAFAWDLSTWVGQTAIVMGSIGGGLVAQRLARSRWAVWRSWALALGIGAAGLALSWSFTNTAAFVLFNPATQLNFAEFFKLGAVSFALVTGLRTQSGRYPQLVAIELGLAAACMASSMAMHRDGAINRPTELGDYAWSIGADPARYIIYAGLIASVAGLLMLFRERRLWRTIMHLTVMALLFGAVMTVVDEVDLPEPELARQVNPEGDKDWIDPNIEPVWGPAIDPNPHKGDDPGGDGQGKGKDKKGDNDGNGDDENGKGKKPGEDDGDRGDSAQDDPWSEFDDEYISEQTGDGQGEGEGEGEGEGGGGSGNSKPPWENDFAPDTDSSQNPPGGGKLTQVYTPDIIPLDRGNVFDGIKDDETFAHRNEDRKPLKIGKHPTGPIAAFDGDVRLRVRPGYVTPLPSVSPDMEVISWETDPPVNLTFTKDGADNFWVGADSSATIRLTFKVEAPLTYFGGELPAKFDLNKVPAKELMPLPDKTRADAFQVMQDLGLDANAPPRETFLKMVEYFRTFEDTEIPERPETMSIYQHLAMNHVGVCRHRAYAFVITANAYGIPTRFVTNDIHAYAESYIPDYGWLQLDLGGREIDMQVTGPSDANPFIPPRSELPEPDAFKKNRDAFKKNITDPKRRRRPRIKRQQLTPEEFAAKYPDRCRKKRTAKNARKPKHDWTFERGTESPLSVAVLHGEHSPPSGNYFFRQEALSNYDGCRFTASRRRDTDNDLLTRFPRDMQAVEIPDPPPVQFRSALDITMGDMITRRKPAILEGVFAAKRVRNPDPSRFHTVLRTQHMVHTTPFPELLGKDVGSLGWQTSLWKYYLKAPLDPRYAALANEAVEKLPEDKRGDPIAQAAAILNLLEETGTLDTTRSYDDDQTEDPTAAFLFGDRHGHAVHFASAMALMLRTRGIPSRLVDGYVSPEGNRRGGSAILLREADAHVWPEMYVRDVGWIAVDPVPRSSIAEGVAPPDPELQRMLGEILRGQFEPDDKAERPDRKTRSSLGTIGRGILWGFGMLLSFALMLIVPLTVGAKVWRRMAASTASNDKAWRLVFRATLDRLAEAGVIREFGEAREAFAERHREALPSLEAHTHAHMRAFLGGGERGDKQTHLAFARQVARELRAATPWWRRVIGFFNPVTLWRAR